MVQIPTPAGAGPQSLGTVETRAATSANASGFAEGVRRRAAPYLAIAEAAEDTIQVFRKQEIDTNLLEIQKQFTEFEQDALFNPETGLYSQHGSNAIGATEAFNAKMDAFEESINASGLTAGAAESQAAQTYMQSGRARLASTHGSYEVKEREAYTNELLAGQVDAQVDHAIAYFNNPVEINRALGLGAQAIDELGRRQGWSAEVLEQKQQLAATEIHLGVAQALQRQSPSEAQAYLDRYKDGLDPLKYQAASAALEPAVNEEIGQGVAAAIYSGTNASQIPISQRSSVFIGSPGNPGALVKVESGGSMTAKNAASGAYGVGQVIPGNLKGKAIGYGVGVIDADRYAKDEEYQYQVAGEIFNGYLTHPSSPAKGDTVMALLAYNWGPGHVGNWIKGGVHTVGGKTIDYGSGRDLGRLKELTPEGYAYPQKVYKEAGLGDPWGAGAQPEEVVPASGNAPAQTTHASDMEQIMRLPPKQQAAALGALGRLYAADAAANNRATDDLVGEAYKAMNEAGENASEALQAVIDANPDAYHLLGSRVASMQDYATKKAMGVDIVTNNKVLTNLITMTADNPKQFMQINLQELATELSPSDLTSLTRTQADMKQSYATATASEQADRAGALHGKGPLAPTIPSFTEIYRAQGVNSTKDDKTGQADAAIRWRVEQEVSLWAREMAADGKPPEIWQINQKAEEVTKFYAKEGRLDPAGLGNETDGNLATVMSAAEDLSLDEVIGSDFVSPSGKKYTPHNLRVLAAQYESVMKRQPSSTELLRYALDLEE